MDKDRLKQECYSMLDKIDKDKELKKVYNDVYFRHIIQQIEAEERDIAFAEKLFS